MFRCEFSGEISDGPVYKTVITTEKDTCGQDTKNIQRVLVKPAEKPVKVVIESRSTNYKNFGYDEDDRRTQLPDTHGTEIVKELTVRACYVEAVRKKYGV